MVFIRIWLKNKIPPLLNFPFHIYFRHQTTTYFLYTSNVVVLLSLFQNSVWIILPKTDVWTKANFTMVSAFIICNYMTLIAKFIISNFIFENFRKFLTDFESYNPKNRKSQIPYFSSIIKILNLDDLFAKNRFSYWCIQVL